jgi:hypothetical protein
MIAVCFAIAPLLAPAPVIMVTPLVDVDTREIDIHARLSRGDQSNTAGTES